MKRGTIKHPKVDRLMAELGVNRREAIGLLHMLWDWAGDYAVQGDIGRWDDAAIANAVEWPASDALNLVAKLTVSGWLDRCLIHRLVIHDWQDHCESWVHKRLKRKLLAFVQPTAACPSPSPSLSPNENATAFSPPTADEAADQRRMNPSWSKVSGWKEISDEDRGRWKSAYPACDLDRQLAAMNEWLLANPEKAHKTRWRRFITNWLSRSQDRGGDMGASVKPVSQQVRKQADYALNRTAEYIAEQDRHAAEVKAERARKAGATT